MSMKQRKQVADSSDYITETNTEFISESESGAVKVPVKKKRKQSKKAIKKTKKYDTETDVKHETEEVSETLEEDAIDSTSQVQDESEAFQGVKDEEEGEIDGEGEEAETAEPQERHPPSVSGDTCSKIKPQDMDLSDEDEEELDQPQQVEKVADNIINKMSAWVDKDIESVRKNQPAYHKLIYAKPLFKKLKNLKVQKKFLENGGLEVLSQWLDKTSDGNYPCLSVIETVLDIVDYLPIETEHLLEWKLGTIIKRLEKKWVSYKIRLKCKDILTKWYRMIFELNVGYDQSGCYEDQYRNYRKKKMQEIVEIRGEEGLKKQKTNTDEYEYERCGIVRDKAMVPTKNMFDFTYRPDNNLSDLNPKMRQEGTKSQILRKMSQMQRDFAKYNKKYGNANNKSLNGGAY